jgi:hypothetical protein
MDVGLSFWIVAIVDASVLRSSYKDKPIGVCADWLASSDRSSWIAPTIPDPTTWAEAQINTHAEGARIVRPLR